MIKIFCDVCGKEIKASENTVHDRVNQQVSVGNACVAIHVIVGAATGKPRQATLNEGAVCRKCLLQVLTKALS